MDISQSNKIISTIFSISVFLIASITILIAKYYSNFTYNSSYIGDSSYVSQKMLLMLVNLMMFYFTYYFIAPEFFLEKYPTLKIAIVIFLFLWTLIAIALLPFNHTVIKKNTEDIIDDSGTSALDACYMVVYKIPLLISFILLISYYIYFCLTINVSKDSNGKINYQEIIFGYNLKKKIFSKYIPQEIKLANT